MNVFKICLCLFYTRQIGIVGFIASTLYLRTTLHHDTINNAAVYLGALFFGLIFIMTAGLAELAFTIMRLPVFYKEKELFLYPAWALSLPMFILRVPWTIIEAGVYLVIVYFITGFSPEPGRQADLAIHFSCRLGHPSTLIQ